MSIFFVVYILPALITIFIGVGIAKTEPTQIFIVSIIPIINWFYALTSITIIAVVSYKYIIEKLK